MSQDFPIPDFMVQEKPVSKLTPEDLRVISEKFKGMRVGHFRRADLATNLRAHESERIDWKGRTFEITQYVNFSGPLSSYVGITRVA